MKITFLSRRFRGLFRTLNSRRRTTRQRPCDLARHLQRLEDRALLHVGNVALADLSAANGGNGSTGASIEGIDVGDQAGQSVSVAGDVNGDGLGDFIVSAHLGDHGAVSDDGELYVVFGKSGGFGASFDPATLTGSNGFRIDGGLAADHAGYSVAGAGDINNDGKADLVIGAPDADPSSRAAAGSVYVVLGAASFSASLDVTALTGPNGFRIDGAVAGDVLGISVAAAGDVNNDGFGDLLLGAPLNDTGASNAGAAYVIFGKGTSFGASIDLSTLTTATGYRIAGTTASDKFGFSVSSAGDVNNDNFDDIVIGAPFRDPSGGADGGAAYVVFGKASGFANITAGSLDGATGFRLDGLNTSDQAGYAVSGAGDLNNDGFDDVLVSSPRAEVNGVSVGASYVVFGKSSGFLASFAVSTLTGTTGFRLAMDYASDPWLNSWIVNTTGALGITNGTSNGILADVLSVVPDGNDVFVKANSVPNFSIGLWGANPNSPAAQNRSYQIPRDPVVNTGTKTVTGLGANGITIDGVEIYNALDGKSFMNQNAWFQNAFFSEGSTLDANGAHPDQQGNYHVHTVPNSLLAEVGDNASTHSSILGWSFDGFPIYGPYGFANADGTGGVVRMNSSWQTRNITQRTVLADGTDVPDGPPVGGPNPIGTFIQDYEFISGLGHLDRYNGRFSVTPEFPQGMYHYVMTLDATMTPSFPYILAPELNGVVETKNISKTVGSPNDIGVSAASIGDFNADGVDDIVLGNPGAYVAGAFVAGAGYVFYGHTGAFTANFSLNTLNGTTNGFFIFGVAQNDGAGTSVSGGGDINGDGGFDLLIGAPGADPSGRLSAGRAFAVYGDSPALTLSVAPSSISENGGVTTGTITRPGSTTSALVVTLVSSDVSEATVPATVTIAAGQASATFTVSAVDDAVVDGSQTVGLTASSVGFTNGLASLIVSDFEALIVSIAAAQISENGGATTLTVTRTDPTGNLTVTLVSGDTSEAMIVATLIIAAGQLASAATTISSVNDDEVDGVQTVNFTASATGYVTGSKTLNVTDDEIAGFTIAQSSGSTIVSESGATDTFTVVLNARPLSNVVLNVSSGDIGEATVGPATLTFTPANFDTPQTVTVTGINDPTLDGSQVTTLTVTINDATSDNAFDNVADQTVSATTTDNDVAGFNVVQSGGNTTVTEAGGTDTFTVVLSAQPLTNVVLNVSSGDLGEATVGPTTLTFTFANWNITQTVTVTGVDDLVGDGDQTTALIVSINAASSDDGFDAVANQTVSAITTDNEVLGLAITQTGGNTSVSESGSTDTFSITLNSAPTSNVVLLLSSGNTGEATIGVTTLTFTPANFNVAQMVTVTGVDDTFADGNQITTITVAVNDAISDPLFAAFADQTVNVLTSDDDVPGFTIAQTAGSTSVSESGSTDTLTVVLQARPLSNVVILISSSDTGEASVGPASLTFTSANWNTPQTVTVTGVDDVLVDGSQTSTLTFSIDDATSNDQFDAVANQTVSVDTTDNDAAVFSVATASAVEGSSITFTITLSNAVDIATSVTFTTSDGTAAVADNDYSAIIGQVISFSAGLLTRTVIVNTTADTKTEPNETFNVTLGSVSAPGRNVTISATNGAAVGTITNDDAIPQISINDVTVTEGNSGATNATLNVTLSNPSSLPVTINFATANGSATAGSDYTATAGTLTFAPGETTKTVTVSVLGDLLDEPDETFVVNLSAATNASILDSQGLGTIPDDDATPSLSIGDVTISEASTTAVFTVTLSAASGQPVTINFATANATAVSTADYTGQSGTLTFAPGETTKTISVPVVDDSLDEPDETFFVNLSGEINATLADGQGLGTILDDDPTPSLSINDVTMTEGNSGSTNAALTVTLSAASSRTVTVNFATSNGTALAGSDFTSQSGTLTFAPGQTTKTVTVPVLGDPTDEDDETFNVDLSNAINAVMADSQGLGTILDDDAAPTLSIGDITATEGNSGQSSATFTVALSVASSRTITLDFATADSSARAPGDYSATSGTLTFAPGQTTKTITVPILGDVLDEPNEVFLVNLSNAVNATFADSQANGTIADDDASPQLSINDVTVTEGDSGATNATFTVTLSDISGQPVSVNYATANSSATAGSDYTANSGTLTFAPGETTKTVTVQVLGDTLDEPSEMFQVNLTNATAAMIFDSRGIGSIPDDDPTPTLSVNNITVAENQPTATFTVTLSAASDQTVTASYFTASGSAFQDFTATSGTLTFAPGETTKLITVPLNDDVLDEPDETFSVVLGAVTNANVIDNNGLATIIDNDAAPSLSIGNVTITEGNTGTTSATFVVTLSTISGQTVLIDYATADGTALAGSDYTATSGTLSIVAGLTSKTFTVPILGDLTDEANETLLVNLSNAINASISNSQGVGTIGDNDAAPLLSINDVTITEGDTGTRDATFTVTLSAASSQTVSVNFATANNTAVASSDYSANSGTLTFAPGETTKTVAISVTGDSLDEASEAFFVNLSNATNATFSDSQGRGTISDDDAAPALSIGDVIVTEGNSGQTTATFAVNLSAASGQAVTVRYATAASTATAATDYTTTSGTLTFAAGSTTQTISVLVKGDVLYELNETFFVNLSSATNASIADSQGLGTITNDDAAPTLSIQDVAVTEGNTGTTTATFTVALSAVSSQAVTVNYVTADNTAFSGVDYLAASGTLTIAAGATSKTFSVSIKGDVLSEANETFFVNLSNAINASLADAQAIGTITDNDATPSLKINDVTVTEGNSGTTIATFTVTLSAASGQAVTVNYATANSTAVADSDFAAQTGTLTFAPGEKTKTISIAITGDTLDEANESYFVKLSSATNATIADNSGTGTITDNDPAPTLSINDATIVEGHSGMTTLTFTVTLSAASGQTVTVRYATANNTAVATSDYTAASGTLSFAAGVTSQTITIQIKGDTLREANEAFFVNLSNAVNATITDNQGIASIIDDD